MTRMPSAFARSPDAVPIRPRPTTSSVSSQNAPGAPPAHGMERHFATGYVDQRHGGDERSRASGQASDRWRGPPRRWCRNRARCTGGDPTPTGILNIDGIEADAHAHDRRAAWCKPREVGVPVHRKWRRIIRPSALGAIVVGQLGQLVRVAEDHGHVRAVDATFHAVIGVEFFGIEDGEGHRLTFPHGRLIDRPRVRETRRWRNRGPARHGRRLPCRAGVSSRSAPGSRGAG